MEFIESTHFFVRAVMYELVHPSPGINLRFRLIPMIHIGSEQYYTEVIGYLNECDEILYEGVKTKKGRRITNQYDSIARKLDLVNQNQIIKKSKIKPPLIHADFNETTGRKEWNKLRWYEKMKGEIIVPLKLFIETRNLTRKKLGKAFGRANSELVLRFGPREDEEGTYRNYVMNAREQIIFRILKKKFKTESKKEKLIGIIYGGGHMNKISRFLIDELNYIPKSGTFIKVFDII